MTDLNLTRVEAHRIADLLDLVNLADTMGADKTEAANYGDRLREAAGLREPVSPAVRVKDSDDVVWAKYDGTWYPLGQALVGLTYDLLIDERGPLQRVES